MITIGLDLSITSTGVTIYDTKTGVSAYYIICNKITQKSLKYLKDVNYINVIQIEKENSNGQDPVWIKESHKTNNIYNIVCAIESIVKQYDISAAAIEGVSFGSSGSVADLAGLNYAVRIMLINNGIKNIKIIPPTQNKKFATGNGGAEKDVMISAWQKMDERSKDIPSYIKIDDVADSYFLSRIAATLDC